MLHAEQHRKKPGDGLTVQPRQECKNEQQEVRFGNYVKETSPVINRSDADRQSEDRGIRVTWHANGMLMVWNRDEMPVSNFQAPEGLLWFDLSPEGAKIALVSRNCVDIYETRTKTLLDSFALDSSSFKPQELNRLNFCFAETKPYFVYTYRASEKPILVFRDYETKVAYEIRKYPGKTYLPYIAGFTDGDTVLHWKSGDNGQKYSATIDEIVTGQYRYA